MNDTLTISATELKAKCLDILDRLGTNELESVVITKRGKVVAVLRPPESTEDAIRGIHGFMRGSVIVQSGFDFTAAALDEELGAEDGILHQ